MPGDLSTRRFYSSVLYTKAAKQNPPLLQISDHWNKEKKFSFVFVNEQFMKSVKDMEDVVLVPTRLLDIEVKGEASIPDLLSGGQNNLFEVFHLLKKFRDKMQAMAVMSEDEISSPNMPLEVDDTLFTFSSKDKVPVDCDSGLWSLSSSASRESIEEDLVTGDDRSSSSGDSDASSLDSTTVVKQSLHSAKSLCSFLNELIDVAHYVVSKYLLEMQCDLCE